MHACSCRRQHFGINIRLSRMHALTRVISHGSVEKAAQDTDLSFYIRHFGEILKEAVKKIALKHLHI